MTENEKKILNCRARKAFLDELRHRRTRQGAFEESFLHHGHPLFGGGPALEPSDGGASAALTRASCEEAPRWRALWARARGKLTRRQRRILDALLVDFRTTAAAKVAGVDRKAVQRFKKTFFKTHFIQCHTAWKRDFA